MRIVALFFLFMTMLAYASESYTGFHIAGIPNFSYKDGEGFAAGGNLFFFQYVDGRIDPYRWNTTIGFKMSTEGQISSYVFLDIPQVLGDNSRFNLYVEYKRYLVDDYYGLGNKPDYNLNYINALANQSIVNGYGGIRSIPTTFLIDKKGNIYKKYVGYNDKSVFENDIKAIL